MATRLNLKLLVLLAVMPVIGSAAPPTYELMTTSPEFTLRGVIENAVIAKISTLNREFIIGVAESQISELRDPKTKEILTKATKYGIQIYGCESHLLKNKIGIGALPSMVKWVPDETPRYDIKGNLIPNSNVLSDSVPYAKKLRTMCGAKDVQ